MKSFIPFSCEKFQKYHLEHNWLNLVKFFFSIFYNDREGRQIQVCVNLELQYSLRVRKDYTLIPEMMVQEFTVNNHADKKLKLNC